MEENKWTEEIKLKGEVEFVELSRANAEKWVEWSEEDVFERVIKWTEHADETTDRRKLVQTLVLMQRPRYLATIWRCVFEGDGSGHGISRSVAELLTWVKELEDEKLLRRKEGHFIWLHVRVRDKLRNWFRGSQRNIGLEKVFNEWRPAEKESAIHRNIARWYAKLLNNAGAPAAVFELAYHLCMAAEARLRFGDDQPQNVLFADECLLAANTALHTNIFLIQTQGFARSSCRRLEYIRDQLCPAVEMALPPSGEINANTKMADSVKTLRVACTRAMRAIAREVGEARKAYIRHRQLGLLLGSEGKVDLASVVPYPHDGEKISELLAKAVTEKRCPAKSG